MFFPTLALQLSLASVPLRDQDWSVLFVTVIGTALAVLTGSLPEWRAEKYACQRKAPHTYAITHGNGHKHVIVIVPGDDNEGLNFDHLACPRKRATRPTRLLSLIYAAFWMVLLIVAAGIKKNTWYLLGVGSIGMLHNILVAGWKRKAEAHGIPLDDLNHTISAG
jgi:hypothetical protein